MRATRWTLLTILILAFLYGCSFTTWTSEQLQVKAEFVRALRNHRGDVRSVAFSAGGRYPLLSSHSLAIKQWEAVAGREVRILSGHLAAERMEVTHTFIESGSYRVRPTIADNGGNADSITKGITITALATPDPDTKDRYAIVIGISDYQHATEDTCQSPTHFCDLQYADEDARSFYGLLVDPEIGNFSTGHVTLLLDEQATDDAIRSAFGRLLTLADEDDLVIIYYSGHGGQGPDLNQDEADGADEYYLPYNTSIENLFGTAICDDDFGNWMRSLRSKHVVIFLDSCFSGGATRAIKGTNQSGHKAPSNNSVFNDFSFESRVLIAASQENEFSHEFGELSHGVFTYFSLEALEGAADLNQDGRIVAEEVYQYVKPKVKEYVAKKGRKQTPLLKGEPLDIPVAPGQPLKGAVTGIEGGKDWAVLGDKLYINLGSEDKVQVGDMFEVYHEEYRARGEKPIPGRGVVTEEYRGKIKVIDVPEAHRSFCEVIEVEHPIYVGDKVRKLYEPSLPPETGPPEIISIHFPEEIAADGSAVEGEIKFEDPDGNVAEVSFELLEGDRSALQIKPDWEFDPQVKGQTEGAIEFTIVARAEGQFKLQITLEDEAGGKSKPFELAFEATLLNRPPVAEFTYTPAEPHVGEEVSFDASGSYDPDPDGRVASYHWDFGDGTTGSGMKAKHAYSTEGGYTVTLEVTDKRGATGSISKTIEVLPKPNQPPIAKFTFSPSVPKVDEPVTFDASDSYDPDGEIVSYEWDFGDGSTGWGRRTTHAYSAERSYTAKLTVTDDDNATGQTSRIVEVKRNQLPVASFTFSPSEPEVNETITFNASGSYDPDGAITSYAWDFGDGTTGSGMKAKHAYSTEGGYTVTLEVTDKRGATGSISKTIEVLPKPNQPPIAKFTFSPSVPKVDEPVTFDASDSYDPDGEIVSYEWDFGDGSTDWGKRTTHAYSVEERYTVKLTVTDNEGGTDQTSPRTIQVRKLPTQVSISPHIVNTLFIGAHPIAVAAHPNKDLVYVSLEKSIAIIDTQTQMYVESFNAGYPDQLEITPDGRFLFAGTWQNKVLVIDTNSNETIAKVEVGEDPAGMAITPDGKLLYVTNNDGASVSVIRVGQGNEPAKVITTVEDIPWPRGICASPDGNRVYVTSTVEGETNSVTVIDTNTQTILTAFTVPDATTDCVVRPDGRYLYVSMDPDVRAKPGGVAVVDTATYDVIADIRTGKAGFTEHVVYGVGGIDVTSDGRFVFVVNAVQNNVSAIDTKTNEIISTLGEEMFGSEPHGLAITPGNKWVYVANFKSNSISVIATGYIAR